VQAVIQLAEFLLVPQALAQFFARNELTRLLQQGQQQAKGKFLDFHSAALAEKGTLPDLDLETVELKGLVFCAMHVQNLTWVLFWLSGLGGFFRFK